MFWCEPFHSNTFGVGQISMSKQLTEVLLFLQILAVASTVFQLVAQEGLAGGYVIPSRCAKARIELYCIDVQYSSGSTAQKESQGVPGSATLYGLRVRVHTCGPVQKIYQQYVCLAA